MGGHDRRTAPAGGTGDPGFLQLQADLSKNEALRWAQLTPGYMGLELRPFQDTANRFYRNRVEPTADGDGSHG
jgi:hypothetical protein